MSFIDVKIHNWSGFNSQIDAAEQDHNIMNGVRANKSTVSSPNLIYESTIEHAKINCVSSESCAPYGSYGKFANDVPGVKWEWAELQALTTVLNTCSVNSNQLYYMAR
ncbi:uncharacterized protein Bfra_011604 [Botrytis fragariae]|uniref:Uncharacterized protein n=1 Tax=Botrytis fragariae TaxID=1964551 RepID=A0A8H6AK30_9HELO|nr:uncharacterized protein Bfra_011604 [Botrytis fragariae]KAF5869062.1 hypothetical protein Bfra_011604 [Botrytis fragariae]